MATKSKKISIALAFALILCLVMTLAGCNKTAVKNITGIELVNAPTVTNYDVGEDINLAGMSIKVIFKKTEETREYDGIAGNLTVSGYDKNLLGEQTVTVTYKVSEKKKSFEGTVSFSVIVAHRFDQEIASDKYLKSPATCKDKAVYYKSCACGEKGSETFTYGEINPTNHVDTQFIFTSNGDGTHVKKYKCCGAIVDEHEECSGGEATISHKAVCELCGGEYGAVLPHAHQYVLEIPEESHLKSAATCENRAVYYKSCACGENGTATFIYGDLAAHAGGEATCTNPAICDTCHKPYGEVNPNNHNLSDFVYVCNGDGTHVKKHACCDVPVEENEVCSGGTATCQNKAVCQYCKVAYGDLASHNGGTATCQNKATCSVCGEEYGELAGHDFGTDWSYKTADGHAHVCRTAGCGEHDVVQPHRPNIESATDDSAVVCLDCGYIITPALNHTTHTPVEDWSADGEYHWKECIGCSTQQLEKAEHTFDDDCDEICNICGYERTVAHSYALMHDEAEHWYQCTLCGREKPGSRVAHTGGHANCCEKAVCGVCEAEYGEKDANYHKLNVYDYECNGDGTHTKTYRCCGVTAEEKEPCYGGTATCKEYAICSACAHAYGDLGAHEESIPASCTGSAYCNVCGQYYGDWLPHTEGTPATCTSRAVCSVCGLSYGEVDPNNHSSEGISYKSNGDGTHSAYHSCCDAPIDGDPIPCEGTAEKCTEPHRCDTCNAFFGDFGEHRGGEATCMSPAICDFCHLPYGELGTHNMDMENWGYVGADGHAHVCTVDGCTHKDAVVAHTPNIAEPTADQDKVCTECGYIIAPKTAHTDHSKGSIMGYDADGHFYYCDGCFDQIFDRQDHVYSNACDTSCNVCGYVREVGEHDYKLSKLTASSHGMKCSICGRIDQDTIETCSGTTRKCTEYPLCDICGTNFDPFGHSLDEYEILHESEDTHVVLGVDGSHKIVHDCCSRPIRYENCSGGHATCKELAICEVCGVHYGEYAPHTVGTPATCLSPAICSVCEQPFGNKDFSNHANDDLRYSSNYDGTHSVEHDCCGQTISIEACSGGHATCKELAICEVCGAPYGEYAPHTEDVPATCTSRAICSVCGLSYGEVDPNNHVSDEFVYVTNSDGTHVKKYKCCGAIVDEHEECSGGEANCQTQARCEYCNTLYGEKDPDNHAIDTLDYTSNGDGTHVKKYICCGVIADANEVCSGGEATCQTEASCEHCHEGYGAVNPDNHRSDEFVYVTNSDGTHVKKHKCCSAIADANEVCSGGEATCTERARCEHCNASYGAVNPDNHTQDTFVYVSNGNGTHNKNYECCGKTLTYGIACTGGTASCSKKAVCDVCEAEYGNYLAHSYDEGICTECGAFENDFVYRLVDASGNDDVLGGYVQMGRYPQTLVTDTGLIAALNLKAGTLPTASDSADWIDYGYYSDGNNDVAYAWYIDKGYDGNRYRGVYFTSYRPYAISVLLSEENSYQDDNGYETGEVYWFRYDPITWRILSSDYDHDDNASTRGETLLLANLTLDTNMYNEVYDVSYADTFIRAWLIDAFYQSAFSGQQQNLILTSTLGDKVFLPSMSDVCNYSYGFDNSSSAYSATRNKMPSDYAKALGIGVSDDGYASWYLRDRYQCYHVNGSGSHVTVISGTPDYLRGIVPSMVAHVHAYDRNEATPQYFKADADCTHSATYYTSCRCGESSQGTAQESVFSYGAPLGHTGGTATCTEQAECTRCHELYGNLLPHHIENGICTICGEAPSYILCDETGNPDCEGGYVLFGSYPQTRADSAIEASLTSTHGANLPTEGTASLDGWTSYGYYKNNTNTQHYAWYKDVTVGTVKYRGVYFVTYRAAYVNWSEGSSNGYSVSTVYWFEWQPILWKIVDDGAEGMTLVSTVVLDHQFYQVSFEYYESAYYVPGSDHQYYLNNYEQSAIRGWLNDNFYNTAFDVAQKANVDTTLVDNSLNDNIYACNDTEDYVYLLGETEWLTYGFDVSISDYAKAQGTRNDHITLRTPYTSSEKAMYGYMDGGSNLRVSYENAIYCITSYGAVVPALTFTAPAKHSHISYDTDESYHSYLCSSCGKTIHEEHVFDESKTCTVCGYESYYTLGLNIRINGARVEVMGIGTATDTDIVIPATYLGKPVQYIKTSAFEGCTNVTSVTIPSSVIEISGDAFKDCTSLRTVTFAKDSNLERIRWGAFENTAIKSLVIPDSVVSIEEGILRGCSTIESITMPFLGYNASSLRPLVWLFANWSWAGANAQYVPSSLKTVVLTSATELDYGAFMGCADIENVTLSSGITALPNNAFDDCSSLKTVVIPESVESIGDCVFRCCTSLGSITIPEGVATIGGYAFNCCTTLTNVTLPSTLTSIAGFVFQNCSSLVSIVIPDGVTTIGQSVFKYCRALSSVTIPEGVTTIKMDTFYYCLSLTSIVIPDSVTTIESSAFYNCINLVTVTFGADSECERIGNNAFGFCDSITSITIPSGVTTIESNAFQVCYRLAEVYNKSSLSITKGGDPNGKVGYYALNVYTTAGGSKLSTEGGFVIYTDGDEKIVVAYVGTDTAVVIPSGITKINNYAFYNNSNVTSVTLPSSLTSIGSSAFSNCYNLVEVCNKSSLSITKGSTSNGSVGYRALNVYVDGDSNITNEDGFVVYTDGDDKILLGYVGSDTALTIPSGITKINQYAFRYNSNIESVVIPSSVTTIDFYAFAYCFSLKNVTIQNGVKTIGYNAFYYCGLLENIVIPDSVTSIGSSAFSGSGLRNVTLPSGITSITNSLFQYCYSLESIVIPDSVTSIGTGAFASCSKLEYVVIPAGLTSVGNAFEGVSGNVLFKGTSEEWSAIASGSVGTDNIYFFSESEPSPAGKYWHYVGGVPTIW